MELSVVIPVYNESKIIRRNLEIVDSYLQTLRIEYEIVVVNDGSSDDTLEQVSGMASNQVLILSYEENKGKGYAINRGMLAAQGQYRLFMDMDLSTQLTEIPKFLMRVRDGQWDVCVGNRNSIGILAQQRPWHRAVLGKIFAFLSTISSGCPLEDFTCGFKIFTAQASTLIFARQQIYNWAFDTELMAIAHQLGLRVYQEPVQWQHHGNSKVRIGPAMMTSLMSLVKIGYSKGRIQRANNAGD